MSDPKNPPAFPVCTDSLYSMGMTLRDWFAGQALLGTLSMLPHLRNVHVKGGGDIDEDALAVTAYGLADAMLAKRAKVPA